MEGKEEEQYTDLNMIFNGILVIAPTPRTRS
jgi:hypothetical protein